MITTNFCSRHFASWVFDMGMMYLRESTSGAAITCYRPHCDKISGAVVFLPLSQFFWTVVAYGNNDYKDDSEEFHRWRGCLSDREKSKVDKILDDALFKNKILSIFKCTPGTAVAFDAENIAHHPEVIWLQEVVYSLRCEDCSVYHGKQKETETDDTTRLFSGDNQNSK